VGTFGSRNGKKKKPFSETAIIFRHGESNPRLHSDVFPEDTAIEAAYTARYV
jgi:hypothetical protein